MIAPRSILLAALLVAWLPIDHPLAGTKRAPNILLIVADDLGYSDLGAFGGEIDTPYIDQLARDGIRFTRFHTGPTCAPSRAMLFSGNNNHVAGMANQARIGVLGFPLRGYENSLSDRVVPFPRLLRDAGYATYIVGKWHLGETAETSPRAAGFTRSFTLMAGAATHFNDRSYRQKPLSWWEDGVPVDYPDGRYSTEVYTDRLIEYLAAHRDADQPFLAVAAYTAPHWPLQVPAGYRDRYQGRYDGGDEELRERRFRSLQAAGIVAGDLQLPPREATVPAWDTLDAEQKRIEARKMELYAAMVDNLDDQVGRLLRFLDESGLRKNTVIIVLSDNGAAGEDPIEQGPFAETIRARFDNHYDNMGHPESFIAYGRRWAEAGMAPFRGVKGSTLEGGLIAPLIVAGPGVEARGLNDHYVTIMDLAPTFLEWASIGYPEAPGIESVLGESMASVLNGTADRVHDDQYLTALYHRGHAMLRKGDLKLTTDGPPFDESAFDLYDVRRDPGERVNLAQREPERYRALLDAWRSERKRLGIVLPEDL